MNRIKYENYLGAAGYDAVARRKIKELEKKIGPQMVEKVLLDEPEATFSDNVGTMMTGFQGVSALKKGQTYQVEIDGNKFNCVAGSFTQDGNAAVYIGNAQLIPDAVDVEDTGEPFAAVSTPGGLIVMVDFPTTYGSVPDIVCAIKITTMEEKNASTGALQVGFILNNGSVGCSNTYAEIQAAIYDAIASVFSGDISKLGSVPHAVLTSFGPSIVSYHCVAVDATEMGAPGVATMAMEVSNIKFYFQNGEEKYMVQMYEDGSIQHYDLNAAG